MLKQLFHISQGNQTETAQQVLSIQVGERHCGFAISNKAGDQLYELAYYTTDHLEANPLASIFSQHEKLNNSFYQVLISYDHPQSTLLPVQHFSADNAGLLMKTLYAVNGTSTIISEKVTEWQLYNVYAVPNELHNWTSRQFAAGKFWHQYSVALKNLKQNEEADQLIVDFRTDDFTVVAASNNKLLLTQTFVYSTPEDVLYQLLKICEQFGLSQKTVQLSLAGMIDQQSALYKELYQYFLHVEFRNASWNIPGDEYPAHFFTSLNELAQCAS